MKARDRLRSHWYAFSPVRFCVWTFIIGMCVWYCGSCLQVIAHKFAATATQVQP